MPFIIDWGLTHWCNLDCSYCGSHNNSTKHPPKDECIKGIEFGFAYADKIMSFRKKHAKYVTLNLLGGEVMAHPDIEELLEFADNLYQEKYKERWHLTRHIITNGIVGKKTLTKCLPFIDKWLISYHTETNQKQKDMCLESIDTIHSSGKLSSVRIMCPSDPEKFKECLELEKNLKDRNIKYELKAIGTTVTHLNSYSWEKNKKTVHAYEKEQAVHFIKYWKQDEDSLLENTVKVNDNKYVIASAGYPCCNEKPLCTNFNRKNPVVFLPRSEFKDWHCSVNLYFLYIKQYEKTIYHNTSCFVRPSDNTVNPIGTLADCETILTELDNQIKTNSVPVVTCPKNLCGCGKCAPKALNKEDFRKIIKIHLDETVLKY